MPFQFRTLQNVLKYLKRGCVVQNRTVLNVVQLYAICYMFDFFLRLKQSTVKWIQITDTQMVRVPLWVALRKTKTLPVQSTRNRQWDNQGVRDEDS